jgi:cell division protein FtsN
LTKDFFADTINKSEGGTMTRVLLILFLIAGLLAAGCSKKQDEIDAIQQEAVDEDAAAVMDSLEGIGTETDDVGETAPAEAAVEPVPEVEEPEAEYADIEGFVVQLGSYRDNELASYKLEQYQNRDYPAFLRQTEIGGEVYYRLRVGVYETYEEAKEVGELLVDRYSATYWIDSNR